MIRRIIELTGLNLKYKSINKKQFFSFDVVEHILTDDDNDYLLAVAFALNDKNVFKEVYSTFINKYNFSNVLCFELETLLLFFCPLACCNKITGYKDKNKSTVTIRHLADNDYSSVEYSLNKYNELFPNNNNIVILIEKEKETSVIPLTINGNKAKIGTWNSYICRSYFLLLVEYIFNTFASVEEIEYDNILFDPIVDKNRWRHNDFYLPLPDTIEELKSRISSKSRHNIKREKRIIEETFGNLRLEDVDARNNFPQSIIDSFYLNKNSTHDVIQKDYDITTKHVTNAYVLKTGDNDIRGIALSCEQGDIAFIENHTFDSSLKQYSFGQVLYDMYLEELVKKGKKGLSLAGGDLSYKKRYGSICFIAYSGVIKKKQLILIKRLKKRKWKSTDLLTRMLFRMYKR